MNFISLIIKLTFVIPLVTSNLLHDGVFLHLLNNVFIRQMRFERYNPIIAGRNIAIITNAAYEALVPYLPDSVAFYSKIPKRPEHERTARNKNIAIAYAMLRAGLTQLPELRSLLQFEFNSMGLNIDDESLDLTTPIGIGIHAASRVLEVRLHDGMNQLGDLSGKKYNRRPYEDYTGYVPKNTAYYLRDPSRWQPDIVLTSPDGVYVVQQYAFPQRYLQLPYVVNPLAYPIPPAPTKDPKSAEYKRVVDDILKESSELNDYKKMSAEYINNELFSLHEPLLFLIEKYKLNQDEAVKFVFFAYLVIFDISVVTGQEKITFDAVRPFSAVRYLYNNTKLTAWGGPGVGTVNDITGWEWRPYLQTFPNSEYPSGAALFCSTLFTAVGKYLGTEDFGFKALRPKGSSMVEPGITPKRDIILGPFKTFNDYKNECALARVWAGVHFRPSAEQGKQLGLKVGVDIYNRAIKFIGGFRNSTRL